MCCFLASHCFLNSKLPFMHTAPENQFKELFSGFGFSNLRTKLNTRLGLDLPVSKEKTIWSHFLFIIFPVSKWKSDGCDIHSSAFKRHETVIYSYIYLFFIYSFLFTYLFSYRPKTKSQLTKSMILNLHTMGFFSIMMDHGEYRRRTADLDRYFKPSVALSGSHSSCKVQWHSLLTPSSSFLLLLFAFWSNTLGHQVKNIDNH